MAAGDTLETDLEADGGIVVNVLLCPRAAAGLALRGHDGLGLQSGSAVGGEKVGQLGLYVRQVAADDYGVLNNGITAGCLLELEMVQGDGNS